MARIPTFLSFLYLFVHGHFPSILNIFISKVKHPENNMNYSGCFLVVCWGWEVGNSVFPAIVTLGAKLRGKTAKFANMGNTIVKVIELCCV